MGFLFILEALVALLCICILAFILWFGWYYPSFVSPSELPGKFKHIGIEYHRLPKKYGEIRYKLYFPSVAPTSKDHCHPPQYFVDSAAIDGIYSFAASSGNKIPKFLYQLLNISSKIKRHPVPCFENVKIICSNNNYDVKKYNNNNNNNNKFPLMIVSHGLAGNWDMYAQFCIGIASFGFIVAMLEHSDKSASHTRLPDGNNLFYEPAHLIDEKSGEKYVPDKWKREHIEIFRGPQIKTRVRQVKEFYYYCLESNKNSDENNVLKYVDIKNSFIFGHSFGGVTAVLATQELLEEWQDEIDMCDRDDSDDDENHNNQNNQNDNDAGACNIKGVITFEPWFEPVPDKRLSQEWNMKNLMIIGDKWVKFKTLLHSCQLVCKANLMNKKLNSLEHVKGFSHTDCCDVPFWGPEMLGAKMDTKAKHHTNRQVLNMLTKRIVSFAIDSMDSNDSKSNDISQFLKRDNNLQYKKSDFQNTQFE